jgi:predicted dehydrogenase
VDEFAPELDALAFAIRNKRSISPDGAQGHRDLIILESIYKSARSRKPVIVRYG